MVWASSAQGDVCKPDEAGIILLDTGRLALADELERSRGRVEIKLERCIYAVLERSLSS